MMGYLRLFCLNGERAVKQLIYVFLFLFECCILLTGILGKMLIIGNIIHITIQTKATWHTIVSLVRLCVFAV